MCGIIGYSGSFSAQKILLDGLEQLEYRGYDSAGIALLDEDGKLYLQKKAGMVSVLREACEAAPVEARCGIGHTRWATHGGVSDVNAHPHSCGQITLIHNGIIENYHEITAAFGFADRLRSETDTEVAACLLDHLYHGDPFETLVKAADILVGSYAFCILFQDHPGKIFCIRRVSPLVAAHGETGSFVASDLTALIARSRSYFVVPEATVMVLSAGEISLFDQNGHSVAPELLTVDWDVESAQKGGYPHFMLKEIHEQPDVLENTIRPRLFGGLPDFREEGIPDELFEKCENITILACGTAMYAGMVGKAIMEQILRLPVTVHIASEFRYDTPLLDEKTLTIVISQSGETIDTLAALRLARECGSRTLAIVNVKGSTIARESDYVLYTHAGPEIAVASTKAYMVQLAVLYLLTCRLALLKETFTRQEGRCFTEELLASSSSIRQVLQDDRAVKRAVKAVKRAENAFFIGRGLDYAFSLEGALKLKEISYIHAEAYAAGELKHGTIALIEEGTPVIALATQEKIFAKTVSNVREVKARGAAVILIAKAGAKTDPDVYDIRIDLPVEQDMFTVFPAAAVLQLLAYYTSDAKGLNVDKPRNLAKSVTVE
ncbi:MAG: glutamine--fructose-6-phosphate transaminase (isomerizing) [Lachnospiraceae bacterium]|jgi:glucosamine--fructose-6-phosphate aminotransferase (isomerizing)|nr:glutamine--fructose-6-phosphate transaminase (isomerizing) [Lachnospiraceae bacterium]